MRPDMAAEGPAHSTVAMQRIRFVVGAASTRKTRGRMGTSRPLRHKPLMSLGQTGSDELFEGGDSVLRPDYSLETSFELDTIHLATMWLGHPPVSDSGHSSAGIRRLDPVSGS